MWLRARLHAAGMRSISNVVDVTNYVMHVYGSPLHAFDRAKLDGGRILVRRATAGEELTHPRRHAAEAGRARPADHGRDEAGRARGDHGRPGQRDLGRDDRGAARGRQLRADRDPAHVRAPRPAHRGLEPLGEGRRSASRPSLPPCSRAASSSISRAPSSPAVPTCTPACPSAPSSGSGRSARTGSSASRSRPPSSAGSSSGSGSTSTDDWDVTVPTWRARDVTREIDLVEEVARVVLDRVPRTMPLRRAVAGHLTREQRLRRLVEDVLVGAGFSEAYTWSLVADDPDPDAIRLPDPMSGDQAILRTTLLDGLVAAAAVNVDAGNDDIALFELARVYLPSGEGLPGGALARRRHRRGRLRCRARRGRGRLRRAAPRAPAGADDAAVPPSRQGGGDGGGLARRAPSGAARRRVGRVRARSRRADGADPRADPLRRRDHVPAAAAGHRRARGRGRRGGRARRRRARRRARPSCGRPASSTSTAATRRARAASRSRSTSRSRCPTGRSRTTTRPSSGSASSPRSSRGFDAELRG